MTCFFVGSLIIAGTAVVLSETVSGSGKTVREEREVAGFDQVSFSGSGRLSIIQTNYEKLVINGDDNIVPLIQSEVSGKKLSVGPKKISIRPSKTIHYELFFKDLNRISLSGSLKVKSENLETSKLTAKISGSGAIEIEHLKAGALEATISGSGEMNMGGEADQVTIGISGSGNFEGGSLKAKSAEVKIYGSGDARLNVSEVLEARISGSGKVLYRGSPTVHSKVSGSGRIKPL